MKYFNKIIIISLLIFIGNQKAVSQVGTLDPTFGDNGVVILDLISNCDASVILNDGKILVTGGSFLSDFNLWRFNPDGTLDASFGQNGWVGHNFEGMLRKIHGMVLLTDGKILFTGEFFPMIGGVDAAILKCNPDGSLDSSFGINGFNSVHINSYNYPAGIVVQNDGKIVIAGQAENVVGNPKSAFLARFMTNGGLDPSFGTNGVVITYYSAQTPIVDIAIRPDGKLLTGGTYNNLSSHSSYQVECYNTDGSVDESFGVHGIARYVFGEGQSGDWNTLFYAMALQDDGKIVCTGTSGKGNDEIMGLCRFNADGSTDLSFGDNGGVITGFRNYRFIEALDIALQIDGKIILSTLIDNNNAPFLIVRYDMNGQLDPTFGEGGFAANIIGSYTKGKNVHVLLDGKILIVGDTYENNQILLARYNGDNVLAANFKEVKATQTNDAITITWQTLNESGTKSFTVERSNNANDYVGMNTVPAKGVASNYSYTDKNPLSGISYYRIRENAVNGTNTFSPVVKVVFNDNGVISLYPNPAKNTVTIKGLNKSITATIRITDMNGREISKQTFTQISSATLNIRALAQGSYFVLVEENGKVTKLRMIKE